MVRVLNGNFLVLEASSVYSNLVLSLNRLEHCVSLLIRYYESCDVDDAIEGIPRRRIFLVSDTGSLLYVVPSISFQTFFVQAFRIVVDSWKLSILLLYILWNDWLYDFRFKSTATAAIGTHPTKAWLSWLVNFKNAIWTWGHFRRTLCNKFLF